MWRPITYIPSFSSSTRLWASVPLDLAASGGVCFVFLERGPQQRPLRQGSRPASAAAVEGLKMVTAEAPDSCSICLEDFRMATPVLAMPCSHLFHAACLKKWLERSYSCSNYD
ncbi:hypothetical protein ZIOFF_007694 [Zingiber officinale]|uniref:RING-type domain-containing protein n=1 Tax=Zingiber officinale TaxID=94328 RepID=A0A8J5M448_ZINOF|nr:hypothetical protein ZIOFF_007694 [Zingiber officinale]